MVINPFNILKVFMSNNNISIRQMARMSGIGRKRLEALTENQKDPTLEELQSISDVMTKLNTQQCEQRRRRNIAQSRSQQELEQMITKAFEA